MEIITFKIDWLVNTNYNNYDKGRINYEIYNLWDAIVENDE